MFKKNRKRNSFLFTATLLGAGAAAYYLTKEVTQGDDRVNQEKSYSSDNPLDYYLDDLS